MHSLGVRTISDIIELLLRETVVVSIESPRVLRNSAKSEPQLTEDNVRHDCRAPARPAADGLHSTWHVALTLMR